jgi:hypothetical protein
MLTLPSALVDSAVLRSSMGWSGAPKAAGPRPPGDCGDCMLSNFQSGQQQVAPLFQVSPSAAGTWRPADLTPDTLRQVEPRVTAGTMAGGEDTTDAAPHKKQRHEAAGSAPPKKVYVLDCGGQYAHLIASRVRKHEALSVIVDADTPAAELINAGAVIVSGGPQSVYDPDSLTVDPEVWKMSVPVLGICYGMQVGRPRAI